MWRPAAARPQASRGRCEAGSSAPAAAAAPAAARAPAAAAAAARAPAAGACDGAPAAGWGAPQPRQRPHVRCRAAEQQAQPQQQLQPAPDPFAEPTVYNDGPLDRLLIWLFAQKIADQLEGVHVPRDATYDDFVRVSREILRGRSTEQQHALVGRVLASLMPPVLPPIFRRLWPASRLSCEINAAVASTCFHWLVGESELRTEAVEVQPGVLRQQRSVVHIKKCRYLEASACVGLCTNMCKVPTQAFFSGECGVPLTMRPNFEDLSCDMIFGQHAPARLQDDPVWSQPCLASCSVQRGDGAAGGAVEPCPKTDTRRGSVARSAVAAGGG